jgi:transposase
VIAVGIDVGKRAHHACFLESDGQEVARSLRFANNRQGVNLLQERLQSLGKPATIGIEASGHYWLGVHRQLVHDGWSVQVINPLQPRALRSSGVRKTKTDQRDAFYIADLIRIGRAKANYVPNDLILQLRQLTRFRWDLVDQLGDVKRHLLAVLDRVFPEFAEQFTDPFGTTARALLVEARTAAEFAALDVSELTDQIERASRKRLGRAKAEALQRAAVGSLGLTALAPAAAVEVSALLEQLGLLDKQIEQADRAIAELLADVEQHVSSIPGLGPTLVATIVAEVGDIDRFPRFESLVAYSGLDPSVFESGAFHGTRQHISKRGSPYLRRALYLAAHNAQLRDPELAAYLHRKLDQGKPYKAALVAVAHKLLARIYVVLKEARPYEVR